MLFYELSVCSDLFPFLSLKGATVDSTLTTTDDRAKELIAHSLYRLSSLVEGSRWVIKSVKRVTLGKVSGGVLRPRFLGTSMGV